MARLSFTPPGSASLSTPTSTSTISVGVSFTLTQTGSDAVTLMAAPPVTQTPANGMQLVAATPLRLFGQIPITGMASEGSTLTVDTREINDAQGVPDPFEGTYQWHRGTTENFTPVASGPSSTAIDDATSATYLLVSDDAGHYIRVVVNYVDLGGNPESVMSRARLVADTNVCQRTQAVRDAIVGAVATANSCDQVFSADLALINGTLDLTDAGLSSLQLIDFAGLSGLTGLEIDGDNVVPRLPANIFSGLASLESLVLSGIELATIDLGAFTGLSALTELNLANNSISALPANVLMPLSALTTLDLSGNSLTALPSAALQSLTQRLTSLDLQGNTDSAGNAVAPFSLAYTLVQTASTITAGLETVTVAVAAT